MDIFRSATLTIALVLLIFMIIVLYYEFRSSKLDTKYPPYKNNCPDYSYSTDIPSELMGTGATQGCKFNKTFDYSKLVGTWSKASGDTGHLCDNLQCQNSNGTWEKCTWSSTPTQPNDMYFISNNKGTSLYDDARKCHLTYDGIV